MPIRYLRSVLVATLVTITLSLILEQRASAADGTMTWASTCRSRPPEKMQQIIHERVMFAPILEYAYFVSIGPRVEYDAVNAIPANPYTAPYEDLRLTKR